MKTLAQMLTEITALEAEAQEWAEDADSVEGNQQAPDLHIAVSGLLTAMHALQRLVPPAAPMRQPAVSRHLGLRMGPLELNDLVVRNRDLVEMLAAAERVAARPELARHTCRVAGEAAPGYVQADWLGLTGTRLLDAAAELHNFILDELTAQAEIRRDERQRAYALRAI